MGSLKIEDSDEKWHTVTGIMERRDEPTQYQAPETDQKWRVRNVISFHWRHLGIKAPPGYRDVMLCAIDHANPHNGRCDAGQRRMARECNLTRGYVNAALQWWAASADFIRIENRKDKHGRRITNAYHINWSALEEAWHAIQWAIRRDVTEGYVNTESTGYVHTESTAGVNTESTGYVHTDSTQNVKRTSKENLKEEPHPERASSCDDVPYEGIQRGGVETASTNSQPSEGPFHTEACSTVSGYCQAFHWDRLTAEEAVAAAVDADLSRH
jgi:hypothetical protein